METSAVDMVGSPPHYTSHPSGVEAITVTEHMNFCIGNAMKYLWRAGLKGNAIEDLRKARWYIDREIQRLKTYNSKVDGVFSQVLDTARAYQCTCFNCAFADAAPQESVCLSCGESLGQWAPIPHNHPMAKCAFEKPEVAPESDVRGCVACAHASSDRFSMPCVGCHGFDRWEPVPAVCAGAS